MVMASFGNNRYSFMAKQSNEVSFDVRSEVLKPITTLELNLERMLAIRDNSANQKGLDTIRQCKDAITAVLDQSLSKSLSF